MKPIFAGGASASAGRASRHRAAGPRPAAQQRALAHAVAAGDHRPLPFGKADTQAVEDLFPGKAQGQIAGFNDGLAHFFILSASCLISSREKPSETAFSRKFRNSLSSMAWRRESCLPGGTLTRLPLPLRFSLKPSGFQSVIRLCYSVGIELEQLGQVADGRQRVAVAQPPGKYLQLDRLDDLLVDRQGRFRVDRQVHGLFPSVFIVLLYIIRLSFFVNNNNSCVHDF